MIHKKEMRHMMIRPAIIIRLSLRRLHIVTPPVCLSVHSKDCSSDMNCSYALSLHSLLDSLSLTLVVTVCRLGFGLGLFSALFTRKDNGVNRVASALRFLSCGFASIVATCLLVSTTGGRNVAGCRLRTSGGTGTGGLVNVLRGAGGGGLTSSSGF